MTSLSDPAARAWIHDLVDDDSFIEFFPDRSGLDFGPEVITGLAKINKKRVAVYASNTQVNRAYVSREGADKICRLMDKALELKIPIIALQASPGIDMQNALASGNEYTRVISTNIALSGVIPQLAIILAPTLGAPAYSSVLMDMLFFNKHRSFLMVTSPTVVKQAIGETVTMSELGGAKLHASVTGLADFVDGSIRSQFDQVRALIDFLPASRFEKPLLKPAADPVEPMPEIPVNPRLPFDMIKLVKALTDDSKFINYKDQFGQSMICAFAHIHGYPVGIVANQSLRSSGAIDADAAQKSARFIRLCDHYNIPILTLIDVPGFMPGKREEQKGLLRQGADMCAAMQTRVPRLSVVIRKCFGAAAFLMMQTHAQKGDLVLSLESAEIGVMAEETTRQVNSIDQIATNGASSSLEVACSLGMVDDIIKPGQIRSRLAQHLEYLYEAEIK